MKLGNDKSDGRIFKYATCLKIILENNLDKNFQTLDTSDKWKKQIQEILIDIQESNYYHSEWKESTKEDYYRVVLDLIEVTEVSSNPQQTRLIKSDFSAYGNRAKKGNGKNHTDPSDIPTPEEAKKFLRKIEDQGMSVVGLRNAAALCLMWDTGARIGEIIQTKLKHVTVKNGNVWVKIQPNKKSKEREVSIFQGSKTLKDWYSFGHPVSEPGEHPEKYLFPPMYPSAKPEKHMHYRTFTEKCLKKVFSQLESNGEVNCSLKGEPNHVWRKANTTFYIVNEWATYDKVLHRHGKSIKNPTLPEYLRMMQSDVDKSIAENIGVERSDLDQDFSHETARSMKDGDLMPKNCVNCGELNRCYKQTCQTCGTELPDTNMPDNLETDVDEKAKEYKEDLEKFKSKINDKLDELE